MDEKIFPLQFLEIKRPVVEDVTLTGEIVRKGEAEDGRTNTLAEANTSTNTGGTSTSDITRTMCHTNIGMTGEAVERWLSVRSGKLDPNDIPEPAPLVEGGSRPKITSVDRVNVSLGEGSDPLPPLVPSGDGWDMIVIEDVDESHDPDDDSDGDTDGDFVGDIDANGEITFDLDAPPFKFPFSK